MLHKTPLYYSYICMFAKKENDQNCTKDNNSTRLMRKTPCNIFSSPAFENPVKWIEKNVE